VDSAEAQLVSTEKHRMSRSFFDAASGSVHSSIAAVPGRRELDLAAVPAFLHIGYVPGTRTLFRGVDCLPGGCEIRVRRDGWAVETRSSFRERAMAWRARGLDEQALCREGAAVLQGAIERALARSTQLVVPLSGGLDSRTLLAGVLELVSPRDVITYTYGVPGAADFEIGNRLGLTAGTRHSIIDMRSVKFEIDRLVETARITDANACVYHPYIWTEVVKRFGKDVTYWPGFTGDGLGGSFYQPYRGDLNAAVRDFVVGASFFTRWDDVAQPVSSVEALVANVTKYDGLLSPHEAVWFENHVERYTTHQIFMQGLRYEAPFMDDAFVEFMLGVPPQCRDDKRLFNDMVSTRYRRWFELPTRDYGYRYATRPLLRQARFLAESFVRKVLYRLRPGLVTHPTTTYADFNVGLRTRSDMRATAQELLAGLRARRVLDPDRIQRIWDRHQAGEPSGYTLMLLASIEANCRAYCD
jgi:asparagine synthase (glutamine-hydrolysing)